MNTNEATPQLLLIVRERLRQGSEEAYDRNEKEIAAACAALGCPHPYLALDSLVKPKEVWWLNAFASHDERERVEAAYSHNAALMERLQVLGARKEDFREMLTMTNAAYRPDLSGGIGWRVVGARFFVVSTLPIGAHAVGAVFESSSADRFAFASAPNRGEADNLATQLGPEAIVLAIQPRWSFPAKAWVDADHDFWNANQSGALVEF
jgi:hypothetical protein